MLFTLHYILYVIYMHVYCILNALRPCFIWYGRCYMLYAICQTLCIIYVILHTICYILCVTYYDQYHTKQTIYNILYTTSYMVCTVCYILNITCHRELPVIFTYYVPHALYYVLRMFFYTSCTKHDIQTTMSTPFL